MTIILELNGWFDFKDTLSESAQWTVEKAHMGKYCFGDLSQHSDCHLKPLEYLDLEVSPLLMLSVVLSSFIFPARSFHLLLCLLKQE